MKSSLTLLAALAAGSLAASPSPTQPRVVQMDTFKNPSDPIKSHHRRKRDDTVQEALENMVRSRCPLPALPAQQHC